MNATTTISPAAQSLHDAIAAEFDAIENFSATFLAAIIRHGGTDDGCYRYSAKDLAVPFTEEMVLAVTWRNHYAEKLMIRLMGINGWDVRGRCPSYNAGRLPNDAKCTNMAKTIIAETKKINAAAKVLAA